MIAAQVDGVKLASGRAHAAADAAVGIDDAHAAAKAAGRLLFDLLFRERAARVAATLPSLPVISAGARRSLSSMPSARASSISSQSAFSSLSLRR